MCGIQSHLLSNGISPGVMDKWLYVNAVQMYACFGNHDWELQTHLLVYIQLAF